METGNLCEKKRDFNQNLIKPSRSFQQLCSIINQLDKDSGIEIAECNRVDAYAKHDADLETCKYSEHVPIEPEKDNTRNGCGATAIEDIMSFLKNVERENIQTDNVNADGMTTIFFSSHRNLNRQNLPDEQICNSEDDLEIARLQIEEKEATIECLKKQLKCERKAACDKIASQKLHHVNRVKEVENKYRIIVKRHQRFIEELINEKADLAEKCDCLAQQIKEMDQKFQRDLKVITERHAVELQRTKDNMAAGEKIRRERWLEMKASKIKEMTIKGLEPELHNMMEQHQRELQELKRAHIQEVQDAELCAMRRSNQQLEQLRIEMTDNHEKLLAKEKNILTARYKEMLEEQDAHFQEQQKTIAEHFEREKSILIAEQKKRDEEANATMEQTELHFQKEMENLKEQQEIAKQNFEQCLRKEWQTWADDYKKQQSENLAKAENAIRNDCQKVRDKQIEIAIARLEKESREIRNKLQQNFDNELQLMKEDYDEKLQCAVKNESAHKNQLLLLEQRLKCTETQFENAKDNLQECMSNLNDMNEAIETLIAERDDAKETAHQEIQVEKRILERKIALLYEEIAQNNAAKDQFITQLHSRIKLIITEKVLIIKRLTKKLNDVCLRCERLERLLDQQRQEYILNDV